MGEKNTIKIFIASAAEVKEEREKAILFLNHLNKSHKHLDLEPIEWEYDFVKGNNPGYVTVQDAINPLLKESHLVIFIFYSRIGSNTLTEFEYAGKENKKIIVFFKTGFSPDLDSNESWVQLLQFKKGLRDSVLSDKYKDLTEFEKLFYATLNQYLAEKYPVAEIISANEALTVLSRNNQELIQMNLEKDKEIKELREKLVLKPNDQSDSQLQKLLAEKEAITNELLKSEEIRKQQEKIKEELESQLTLQKNNDDFKAKALKAVEEKDYDAAESFLKESAKGSFSDAASTLYELAKVKKLQFQYAEALNYYEMAIRLNPKNSLYLHEAGSVALDLGFYDRAIALYEEALLINKKTLGEEHIDIAIVYNDLGLIYYSKGEDDRAIELFEKALVIYKKSFAEEHSYIATGYNNLGLAYDNKGEYDKAIEFYEKALVIYKKSYGEEHSYIATGYNNLGLAYNNKGEFDRAIELYEKVLVIGKNFFGKETPDFATWYNNLGLAYDNKDEYDKAIEFYEKALTIDTKFYGNEHPNIALRYNNIGSTNISKGEYDKAIEFCEKSLAIYKIFYKEENPDIARVYNNLGFAYYRKGAYDKAIELYEKALVIDQKYLGKEHPAIAIRYNNLGLAYNDKMEYSKAIGLYQMALAIGKKFLPANHPNMLIYQENLTAAQSSLDKQKKKKPGK